MKKNSYTPEQIVENLRKAELALSQGQTIAQVIQSLGIVEQTYYRWRQKYGGSQKKEVQRLRELEKENARLKRIVADQALDLRMARDVIEGKV